MPQQRPGIITVDLGSQPPPVELLSRGGQLRAGQHPSGRRAAHPRRGDHLIEDSGLVGLGRLLVRGTELVRDMPSCTHRDLAFHQASLPPHRDYALKEPEAPATPKRSKKLRHVALWTLTSGRIRLFIYYISSASSDDVRSRHHRRGPSHDIQKEREKTHLLSGL